MAVLGATGAVGQELLQLLEERAFPVAELTVLASPRSAGASISWRGESLTLKPVEEGCFDNLDLVLASAGGSISRQWAPRAVAAGAVVIDNSSAFRLDPAVPLVVPEVNPRAGAAGGAAADPARGAEHLSIRQWRRRPGHGGAAPAQPHGARRRRAC